MASLSKTTLRFRGNWKLVKYSEAASQSFAVNAPVKLSSGKVAIAVATGSNVTSSTGFLGFAVNAATGTTDADCWVRVPGGEDAEFCVQVTHATPASAVTAVTQRDTNYELEHNATYGVLCAIDDTSNPAGKVVEIAPEFAVGTQYGSVWVRPLATVSTLGRA